MGYLLHQKDLVSAKQSVQHFLQFYRAGKSGGNDVGVQPLVKIENEEMRATDNKKNEKGGTGTRKFTYIE